MRIVVATANICSGLAGGPARSALASLLDQRPDLVGLQEWYAGRIAILLGWGPVRLLPGPLRLPADGSAAEYHWHAPLIGDCVVGARADRFTPLSARSVLLDLPAYVGSADRWHGIDSHRMATVARYADRLDDRIVSLVSFHLAYGVQADGRYRADRARVVARHRHELAVLQDIVAAELARGNVVHAVGDGNFDGLELAGLTSAWADQADQADRSDAVGTLGHRRVDDVFGPGPAQSVRTVRTGSDHRAVVATRML